MDSRGTKDLEDEHDGAEPSEDDEPSLGSFDRMVDQTRGTRTRGGWTQFCTDAGGRPMRLIRLMLAVYRLRFERWRLSRKHMVI